MTTSVVMRSFESPLRHRRRMSAPDARPSARPPASFEPLLLRLRRDVNVHFLTPERQRTIVANRVPRRPASSFDPKELPMAIAQPAAAVPRRKTRGAPGAFAITLLVTASIAVGLTVL